MKPIHYYALVSTSLALTFSSIAYADEGYEISDAGDCCEDQGCPPAQERVNYRYRYRTFYPVGCAPYYSREHGVPRHAQWAGRIYEPFHEQLAR